MQFTTIHFIFLFLPAFLLLYYLVKNPTWRSGILVIGSLFFFAWGDFSHLLVLISSVVINYFFGLEINNSIKQEHPKNAKVLRFIGILLNLLLLVYFKYTGFFLSIIKPLIPSVSPETLPTLPLGISFFTFTGISYLMDIYQRRTAAEKNFLEFSAFFVMFPKIIQGPITTYKNYQKGLSKSEPNTTTIAEGIRKFVQGLAKKVLIADALAIAAAKVFETNFSLIGAGTAWFGLAAFTIQIYFDFSGYTDMAIGLGQILGFTLPENFNFPYISRSITEFWRRWHITLSQWFRSYVFLPLEFKRRRVKHFRQPTHLLIVFFLTGLWHGASWNFVLWGIYFGIILVIESLGFAKRLEKLPKFTQHLYSILLIVFGWMMFRIVDISTWGNFLSVLFGANGWSHLETMHTLNIVFYLPHLVIGILLSTPLIQTIRKKVSLSSVERKVFDTVLTILLFILSISHILLNGFTAFIYEQF